MKTNKKRANKAGDKKSSKITLANHQDVSIISNLHGRLKKCASRQVDVNMIAEKVESIDTLIDLEEAMFFQQTNK